MRKGCGSGLLLAAHFVWPLLVLLAFAAGVFVQTRFALGALTPLAAAHAAAASRAGCARAAHAGLLRLLSITRDRAYLELQQQRVRERGGA